jgi:hypothetical protein
MGVDLLTLQGLEPPAGDLGIKPRVSACRALWTRPLDGEAGAPARRIIHARTLQLHAPARLGRLGIVPAQGYHKCGSHMEFDWVTDVRVLVWDGTGWRELFRKTGLPRAEERIWIDMGGIATAGVVIEIRRCGIDQWWPSWNLASGAFVLEGDPPREKQPRGELALRSGGVELEGLPAGMTAYHRNGEVRFRSRYLEVGFCLRRAGFSWLALDDEGAGRTEKNLLWMSPGISFQGIFLHPVGGAATLASSIRYAAEGSTVVRGNSVRYAVQAPEGGQTYDLRWEIGEKSLRLEAERTGMRDLRAWESSVWTTATDARASASTDTGIITKEGESGILRFPLLFHAPGYGSLEIQQEGGEASWRADCVRPANLGLHQLKLGEVACAEGDHLLRAGRHHAVLTMGVRQFGPTLRADAPPEVARAVGRCTLTALTYRADTGTLSNNGNSMHCPLSMDVWSGMASEIGEIAPGFKAFDLVRDSIERWLDGGPGYGSGGMLVDGHMHLAEDEYLMSGTAALLGIAEFLEHEGTAAWLDGFGPQLERQLALMKGRDVDGDGLVESIYRIGNSGDYQWSTCFFDVISFGWKCAFSNALLYPALRSLARSLPRLGKPSMAEGLDVWASALQESYLPAFFNPVTGWLGGWRSKDGMLHDHAFITVNGAAVASGVVGGSHARGIMERLWKEAGRVGMPDPLLGIPVSLWPIPDEDLAEIMHGFPFGYYGNGGLSMAQSKHLVNALYRVGMENEADHVLRRICAAFADALVFGGAKSGVDARSWDGWPCGYEGLLADQFGVLATAMKRYRA